MKRVAYFDNLKLLLIFLVIFGHFCEISAGTTTYGVFLKFVIYIFHIPLFIFVSGLFNRSDDPDKVRRRVTGFILIYLIMKVVSLLDHMIMYREWHFTLLDEGGIPWFMLAMGVWTAMAYVTRDFNKKVLLVIGVLTALAAGYDYSLTTQFSVSRIIVYWPFFLLGEMADRQKILDFVSKKGVRICGIAALVILTAAVYLAYDSLSYLRPMLSGRASYEVLGSDLTDYGGLIRLGVYVLTVLFSAAVMAAVPARELFCTRYGSRTLSIYFLCLIVYHLCECYFPALRIWQYFVISVILIPILGSKRFNRLLTGLLK